MTKNTVVMVLVVLGVAVPAVYADNCYVHERGSDSWLACKEQAGAMAVSQASLDRQIGDLVNQGAYSGANLVAAESARSWGTSVRVAPSYGGYSTQIYDSMPAVPVKVRDRR